MKLAVGILLVVAGVVLYACRGNDPGPPAGTAAETGAQQLIGRIDAIAEAALRDGPVAGLSIAVFRGSEPILAKGYGFSDIEARTPATAETVYDLASVSKLFTALAVMKLVDDGKLKLDDDVAALLPAFPNPEQGGRMTVRQLLNHTSGLNDYLLADFVRLLHSEKPVAPLSAAFVLDYLEGRALDSEPGTEWQYSNSGFYIAGLIIEQVSGRRWGDYVRDSVAVPLGLRDTVSCDALWPEQRTRGYEPAESGFDLSFMYAEAGVQGDGGLCGTVLDLGRLPAALAQYRLLPETRIREMLRPTALADGISVDYGLGVRLGRLEGHPVWGHTGSVLLTYGSALAHYPEDGVTIAVLVNTTNTAADALVIEGLVAQAMLGLDDVSIAERPLRAGTASVYAGEYVGDRYYDVGAIRAGNVPNSRQRSRIVEDGGKVSRVVVNGDDRPPLRLVPLGNHRFGRADWPMDRFVFDVEAGRARGYSEYYNGIFATFNRRQERQDLAGKNLALKECDIANNVALCGSLAVPENRDQPTGRTIDLNVVVLPATGIETAPPLIDLAGGPGLAATGGAAWYASEGAAWRENRDIVLFDQRGTGGSAPAHCPGFGGAGSLSPMYPLKQVRECAEALARTHDLGQYSSLSAVRDLDAMRDALGAEQIDLFAMSYGTRLAQAYIRAYPKRVRAAAFVGAVPMDPKAPLPHASNAESVLQAIFDDCERDARCAAAFPDLRRDWEALTERIERSGLAAGSGNESRVIERGPFMEAFRTTLTVSSGQRKVPALIKALSAGDTDVFLDMVSGDDLPVFAEGAYLSIECTEGTNRIDAAEIDALSAGTFLGRYRVDEQMRACSVWPATGVPESFFEPVASDVPLLLVVGGRDPVTPPEYSAAIATGFRDARMLVVEEMGHVPEGISGLDCLDRLMLDHYSAPLAAPDSSCVGDMRAPPFEVPAGRD